MLVYRKRKTPPEAYFTRGEGEEESGAIGGKRCGCGWDGFSIGKALTSVK
jgi:hypothetical protein